MKAMKLGAAAGVSMLLLAIGFPGRQMERRQSATPKPMTVLVANSETSEVTLTLATQPVSANINQGDSYGITLAGTWTNTGTSAVYLQASDDAGTFVAPAPALAPKLSNYRIAVSLPKSTPVGVYTGTFTVRACADSLCQQVHADTTRTIGYTLKVIAVGEWETVQRNSRHDGYVPVSIDPTRYHVAWSFPHPGADSLSPVVTDDSNVYFSEPYTHSVYAKRAIDGTAQWRRVLSPGVNPPTVSNGFVYATTTAQQESWLYAMRASDGLPSFQAPFDTQGDGLLNPTVHNGKAYINAGYYGGMVLAFDAANGAVSWTASGGTSNMNTPAVDDDFVYAFNTKTLNVYDAEDGSLLSSLGPDPDGMQDYYTGTPMLGSPDHVLAYSGRQLGGGTRPLGNYSVANQSLRWISTTLYSNYPAVAKGVVYATSNQTITFDALDEATGRLLWSWKPSQPTFGFIGNVVVTNNVAFVSTTSRIYAIDLKYRRAVWSAPTPGTISMSANRMLFISSRSDASTYPTTPARITAYRLDE